MKKKLLALLLALVMLATLAACSGGSENADTTPDSSPSSDGSGSADENKLEGKLICYCPPTLSDTFLASIAEKVGARCEEMGMEFQATEGEFNITVQIQQTENFIARGADLIICQPVDVDTMSTVVEEARKQGVKVMFLADDPTYDVEGYFLSVDEVQGQLVGQMASAWIDKTFPNAGEGEIKVALLQNIDRPASQTRCEAIQQTIESDPRCTVVFEKAGLGDSTASAQTAMDECLALYPDINLVLCFDEVMAIGANSSIMSDATLNKDNIAVFGANITDTGYELVDQSNTNDSVIRGLVTFGEGDAYYDSLTDAIVQILLEEVPENTAFFAQHQAYNTVGFESSFDPTEYAASYVDKH